MTRRKTYHHGDLPATLQRGVLEIVGESGLDAVTMAEVARRAGVTAASPYRHYESLQGLLVATAIASYQRFSARLEGALARVPESEPLLQIEALIRTAFIFFAEQPAEARLILDGRLVQWSEEYAGLIRSEYERIALLSAQAAGVRRDAARTLALNCSALFLGHVSLHISGFSPVSSLAEAPDLAIAGIRQLVLEARAEPAT